MPGRIDMDDPITLLLTPPADETTEERILRLQKEADARRVSAHIDEVIEQERDALKNLDTLKMLLLGQSGSGKSTTLKNIQMTQAPDVWHAERSSWRAVVQLNLVRAVNIMVDVLSAGLAGGPAFDPPSSVSPSASMTDPQDDLDFTGAPASPVLAHEPVQLTDAHAALRLRLGPLRRVEADLKRILGAAAEEVTEASLQNAPMVATPFDTPSPGAPRRQEFVVRSHEAWKASVMQETQVVRARPTSMHNDVTDVIAALRDEIMAISRDDCVRELMRRRRVTLEDSGEYFLEHVPRIASRGYEPTDDDVVRARLRTLGVQEYRIPFRKSQKLGTEWRIYDVGGARTLRHAWLPYFDDADAILFLAPISCFDERLAEDRRVNSLKDSVILWKAIVGAKLLEDCTIILFLNKCDLLKKKLDSGVMVNKYIPRYGNRPNDGPTFSKYIRDKFKDYMREYSPKSRQFYGYLTSVVDTRATARTLAAIKQSILEKHLKEVFP